MKSTKNTMYGTFIDGSLFIIKGTKCSERHCREYGCDFPKCATFTDEQFDTEDDAKVKYPSLELV